MNRFIAICIASYFFASILSAQNGIRVTKYISGVTAPVGMAHCNDDRLFVIEQGGKIKIIENSKLVDSPFLDITTKVRFSGEQGLLGLAFHPRYDSTGYLYVNYISRSSPAQTIIERYKVSAANKNKIDPLSGQIILTINQPYANHNGGCIKFRSDGYLYIGMGDGGSGGDPQNFAQNKKSLLGKMLRIDIDTVARYKIPRDNPFVNDSTFLPEIWAIGLRNPWRFSFDKLTQDLWIGDVGQGVFEEVDFDKFGSIAGKNYGWRCYEGNKDFNTTGCLPKNTYSFPIHQYPREPNINCASITGGYVYRGLEYPSHYGKYFYTDYCFGKIWLIERTSDTSYTNQLVYNFTDNAIASFGEDSKGGLYFTDVTTSSIFRISDTCTLKVNVLTQNPSCVGNSNGRAMTNLLDPAKAKFLWSTGDTIAALNNLKAGIYSVSVEYNGCLAKSTFELIDPITDTTIIPIKTCDPNQVGSDTLVFISSLNCDSLVVINKELTPRDSACITTPFITSFCAGDSAVLIACDHKNAISYQWYKDNQVLVGAQSKRLWVYDSGFYQCSFKDSAACESYFSTGISITVFPIPLKPVIQLSRDTLVATTGYPSYRWFLDGKLLGGSTNNIWKAIKEGIYQVEVIDSNQCHSVLSDTIRYIITNTDDKGYEQHQLELYPNPVYTQLIIRLKNFKQQSIEWKILNAQADCIVKGRSKPIQSTFSVDVKNLLPGFYLLIIEKDQKILTKYFLKY